VRAPTPGVKTVSFSSVSARLPFDFAQGKRPCPDEQHQHCRWPLESCVVSLRGEHGRAFLSPAPHATYVDMDKLGSGVIANSTIMKRESRIAKGRSRYAGNTNVDGHGLHVQAVEGNAVAMCPQIFIAPRRPVATDNVDLGIGPTQADNQIVQKIEHARVVVMDVAGAMISQEVVKAIQGLGQILTASAIYDVEVLAGVRVKKFEPRFR
jgi:hypothetical protein